MLRRLYDWTMAKASDPRAEWWLALFAFVEASFFPIPPHPVLGLMCLAAPRKAIRFAIVATLASVAGGLLGYAIGHFVYDTVGTQLLAVLGLTESFPKAACYLREYGAEIIMIKGATPWMYWPDLCRRVPTSTHVPASRPGRKSGKARPCFVSGPRRLSQHC